MISIKYFYEARFIYYHQYYGKRGYKGYKRFEKVFKSVKRTVQMEFERFDRMDGLRTVCIASNEPIQVFERTVWTIGRLECPYFFLFRIGYQRSNLYDNNVLDGTVRTLRTHEGESQARYNQSTPEISTYEETRSAQSKFNFESRPRSSRITLILNFHLTITHRSRQTDLSARYSSG